MIEKKYTGDEANEAAEYEADESELTEGDIITPEMLEELSNNKGDDEDE